MCFFRENYKIMKNRLSSLLYVSIILLMCACGTQEVSGGNETEETATVENEDVMETVSEAKSTETISEAEIIEIVSEAENIENEDARVSIRIENPSWNYYTAESVVSGTKPYTLKLVEESTNEVIDTEEWRAEHELNYESKNAEGNRLALVENGGTLVNIYEDGTCIAGLDFADYIYAPDLVEEYKEFVDETVQDAKIVNGILYVSVFHYTYAEFAPSNAYIVAINLEDYSVIWKSQPLVCNSLNFEIVDDIIFCGYGFTAEPDYLYQLDRITGCVLDKTELKSKPDYIICVGDTLSVRTYNTDYVFEIVK